MIPGEIVRKRHFEVWLIRLKPSDNLSQKKIGINSIHFAEARIIWIMMVTSQTWGRIVVFDWVYGQSANNFSVVEVSFIPESFNEDWMWKERIITLCLPRSRRQEWVDIDCYHSWIMFYISDLGMGFIVSIKNLVT